jgi:hypothetical protein
MSTPPVQLTDEQRDGLTKELFARWEAAEPNTHKCFTGGDRDLVEAVERYRDEQDRERS